MAIRAPKVSQEYKAHQALQESPYLARPALLASLVNEEKKATKDFQVYLCQDRVEEMGCRAPPAPQGPPDSQATQMELWNVSLDRLVTRGPLEFQGSRD